MGYYGMEVTVVVTATVSLAIIAICQIKGAWFPRRLPKQPISSERHSHKSSR